MNNNSVNTERKIRDMQKHIDRLEARDKHVDRLETLVYELARQVRDLAKEAV